MLHRTHDGWTAEFAIPFRTLRFDPNATTWGLQIRRLIKRKSESTFWSPIGRDADLFRLSKAGTLTGLEGLETGRNLRVKPYVSASNREWLGNGESESNEDLGLDVKWGVTQGLSLDLTVNTDFAGERGRRATGQLDAFFFVLPRKAKSSFWKTRVFSNSDPILGPS